MEKENKCILSFKVYYQGKLRFSCSTHIKFKEMEFGFYIWTVVLKDTSRTSTFLQSTILKLLPKADSLLMYIRNYLY